MEALSEIQQQQLKTLMRHLGNFPLAELMVASADLRCPRPLDDQGRNRMRQALAGAFAFEKATSYLQVLRSVDQERDQIGRRIFELQHREEDLQPTNPKLTIELRVERHRLSGLQEVTFHFYASCVAQIARLLPLIAKATGNSIHSGDKTILESYTPLRHHFEHLNERAPGKVRDEEIFAEHQSDHHWGFKIGFESDEFDRIILYGQPIDVTTRGLRVIEALMQRAYEGFKAGCLEQVEQHFIKHPEDIPAPCDVPYHPFVSIADEKL